MGKYIAFLDILGFKEMITKNSHEEMERVYDLFRMYVQMSLSKNRSKVDERGLLVFDVSDSTINSVIVSDSLIFWTNEDNVSGLFEIIECMHNFLSFCHNLPHLYLRGAVTYGKFTYLDNGVLKGRNVQMIQPMIVGKALVDVSEIEKNMEIIGCVITTEAITEAKQSDSINFEIKWNLLVEENKIVSYNIPMKRKFKLFWTVNWVRKSNTSDLKELISGFSSFGKTINHKSVRLKIRNTVQYFLFVNLQCYQKKIDPVRRNIFAIMIQRIKAYFSGIL